ncbi:MAG: PDDEXK nuclease domain-containing protein [Bacteroidetes bacterium]|nr:PDDEXK nuclease domain-containing protein [Bacteroidota bacterium]
MNEELILYKNLLVDIKGRIRQGQLRANLSANVELLATYWDIGCMIHQRQQDEGWGKGVIPRLARDLKNELAEVKGFSERNILRMLTFYKEYSGFSISPLPVAKLEDQSFRQPGAKANDEIAKLPVSQLENQQVKIQLINLTGWAHHVILIQKVKDLSTRFWYMQQSIANGWSRDSLVDMIKSQLHLRQGNVVSNFDRVLPLPQSDLAIQLFKDPYIFDFMTLATPFTERELELGLVKNVEKFLLELGAGFAFVGRQYKLEISDKDFYIDLLFYHLKMRCFIVIELKKGDFIPEYAGKMNFYCSAVDDMLKHATDQPTIGLILCQGKDKLFAEYSLKDINKPIGISEYELTRALPDNFKGSLPSIKEIEEALAPGHIIKNDESGN